MPGRTAHFALLKLLQGEAFSTNGYEYTNANRELIDQLLYVGAQAHHHNAATPTSGNPLTGPTLTLDTTGAIPGGVTVYYKYALVDANGFETAASPQTSVSTPIPVAAPNPPSLTRFTTGGTVLPGNYYYELSAYYPFNTQESTVSNPVFITISSLNTNKIRLNLPTLPAGANGFNVYRKRPGEVSYFHVAAVPMNVATPPTYWDDTGIASDCDRRAPTVNTTSATNSVIVSLPGATPVVPVGYTWKLYRTYVNANYVNSLLQHVVEQTTETSGIITPTYTDTGASTGLGAPLATSTIIDAPDKINLLDAAEVQNRLPQGLVGGFPYEVTFDYPGPVGATTGYKAWVCEFPRATIMGARASLGMGYWPASSEVIVDVNKGSGTTPTYTTIYTDQATRPKVPLSTQIGTRTTPQVTSLVEGDSLTVDVDQSGGGASPTDRDLTVTIILWAQFDTVLSDNSLWD